MHNKDHTPAAYDCGGFLCRALSESKLKVKLELSANQSGTLNECESETKHEFSERDKEKGVQDA